MKDEAMQRGDMDSAIGWPAGNAREERVIFVIP
jgi:hypothetical protein